MNRILTQDHGKYIIKADLLEVSGWKEKTLWYWVKKSLNETHEKQYLKGKPDRAFPWAWVVAWRDGEIDGKAHPFTGASDHAWQRFDSDDVEVRVDEEEEQKPSESGGGEPVGNSPALDNTALRKFNLLLENLGSFNAEEFKNELTHLIDEKVKNTLRQLPKLEPVFIKKGPWWKNFGVGMLVATVVMGGLSAFTMKQMSETQTVANSHVIESLEEQLQRALGQQNDLKTINETKNKEYIAIQATIAALKKQIDSLPSQLDSKPALSPWLYWGSAE